MDVDADDTHVWGINHITDRETVKTSLNQILNDGTSR